MKFVDRPDLKPSRDVGNPRDAVRRMIEELQTQPGRWAEIARYPLERHGSAKSRASMTRKRYPEIEYAVERDGDEFILYFRISGEES